MSNTILGLIVSAIAIFLPKLGITIGSDELTSAISTIITIVGGLWAWYGRYRVGDISIVGTRKG